MKRKPLLPWVLLAASLFLFQFPTNPTAGVLPGKIPTSWTERLVELRTVVEDRVSSEVQLHLVGVLVGPKTILTCRHWENAPAPPEFWSALEWDAIFLRGFEETQRIRVAKTVSIEGLDLCLFELSEAPKNAQISPIAKEEPGNGSIVAVLGSPLGHTRLWMIGVYSGERLDGPPDAFGVPLAVVGVATGPGSSGGPVFDADGRLVGIVSACQRGFPATLVSPLPDIKRALDNAGISR